MLATDAARATPAATGRDPQVSDRAGGTIDFGSSTTQHAAATVAACHDRNWWRTEGRRVGSNWPGILALHAEVVAAWRRRRDPDYGGVA